MPVELRNNQRRKVDIRRLKKISQVLLDEVGQGHRVLSVLLTDDAEMADLHERWMGDPAPTDVLSFPAEGVGPAEEGLLGDIAISVETAARRSPRNLMKEIESYLVHGVLHLTGHDHARAAEKKRMWAEARRLKQRIGKIS